MNCNGWRQLRTLLQCGFMSLLLLRSAFADCVVPLGAGPEAWSPLTCSLDRILDMVKDVGGKALLIVIVMCGIFVLIEFIKAAATQNKMQDWLDGKHDNDPVEDW